MTRYRGASTRALMFIRFTSGELDPDARVPVGLFNALDQLYWSDEVPEYERQALREIEDWFDENLACPETQLWDDGLSSEAVCWFKSNALAHLSHAWKMVQILERNDVLIWTIRSQEVGLVYYEDEAQVFARPTRAVRRLLRK
jgi:hypothetical protein